ncbi:MAG: hypothetical protein ABL994_17205, partial [Verrucomicrobiales bacterium]
PDGSFLASLATSLPDERVVRLLPDGSSDPAGPISLRNSVVVPFPGGKALVYDSPDQYPNLPGNPFDLYDLRPVEHGFRLERLLLQFAPEDIGRKARAITVTPGGLVWAFLVPAGGTINTPGTLTRFLADGRRDPSFTPATPIRDLGFWSPSDWFAPTSDGGIYIYLHGGPLQRYQSNGQLDASFVWDHSLLSEIEPPAAVTPDDGVILPPEPQGNFRKLRRDGSVDHSFASEITDWGRGFEGPGQCHVADESGSLWILHSGFRAGVSSFRRRISRLLPDGRRDPAFSDHHMAEAPLAGIRVTVEVTSPHQSWRVEGSELPLGSEPIGSFAGDLLERTPALHPAALPRRLLVYEAPLEDERRNWASIFFRLFPVSP